MTEYTFLLDKESETKEWIWVGRDEGGKDSLYLGEEPGQKH